nr:flavoprotein [Actinomadura rugatobispora]
MLYLVCCGAPPAGYAVQAVDLARARGWDVCVIGTTAATKWLDVPALTEATGHPVRTDYKAPDEPDVLPPPTGILVAPATVNTINKWGAGICDTLALGLIVEAIGLGLPIAVIPHSNRYHAAHPMVEVNLNRLQEWGVRVVGDIRTLHEPSQGNPEAFPWASGLDALERP